MNEGLQDALLPLGRIRDAGPYSSRNASKGALISETFALFKDSCDKMGVEELKKQVIKDNSLHKKAFETRRRIWNDIRHRYLAVAPAWVGCAISRAALKGISSPEYISLAYLHFSLRDRLIYDFITGPIWDKWLNRTTNVDRGDVLHFLDDLAIASPQIKKWSESTRKKLAGNVLSSLRDFGLLKGVQKKYIQRPAVAPETVYHLLCILIAEGKEGRSIVEATDWRLFLWSEPDVSNALTNLAQMRWITFEKVGKTTMFNLIRLPEGLNE